MKKALRKLIPTLVMVMITASMVGTSTFAWFSMNNKVTVTGMSVTTKVGDNLLISATSDANPTDNPDYQASIVKTDINALLEPVSSINGLNETFYYTSTTNVKGNGDAIDDIYVNYNSADTSAFNTNYGTIGAVGYADYVFTLKAMNSGDSTLYLDITQLDLRYGAASTEGDNAFRVAVLAKEYNEGGAAYGDYASKTVLGTEGLDYQSNHATYNVKNDVNGTETPADSGKYAWDLDGDSTPDLWGEVADPTAVTKWSSSDALSGDLNVYTVVSANANAITAAADLAVNNTSKLAKVQNLSTAATIAELAAGATKYYEVTVRLWIEGEDEDCTTDTFKALTDSWQLDLTVLLQNASDHAGATAPVTEITKTGVAKVTIADYTISATTKLINGVVYRLLKDGSGDDTTLYTTEASGHLTPSSRIYTIADGVRPVDVTNKYRTYYIVTIVDNAENVTAVVDTFKAYYGHYDIEATGIVVSPSANVTATCSPVATTVELAANTIKITDIAADTTITLADAA